MSNKHEETKENFETNDNDILTQFSQNNSSQISIDNPSQMSIDNPSQMSINNASQISSINNMGFKIIEKLKEYVSLFNENVNQNESDSENENELKINANQVTQLLLYGSLDNLLVSNIEDMFLSDIVIDQHKGSFFMTLYENKLFIESILQLLNSLVRLINKPNFNLLEMTKNKQLNLCSSTVNDIKLVCIFPKLLVSIIIILDNYLTIYLTGIFVDESIL